MEEGWVVVWPLRRHGRAARRRRLAELSPGLTAHTTIPDPSSIEEEGRRRTLRAHRRSGVLRDRRLHHRPALRLHLGHGDQALHAVTDRLVQRPEAHAEGAHAVVAGIA